MRLGRDLHLAVGVLDDVALVHEPMQVAKHGGALRGERGVRRGLAALGGCLGAFRFFRLGGELVEDHPACAVPVLDNEQDDGSDAVADRGVPEVEMVRTRHGDVGDAFFALEKLEAVAAELLAEQVDDLQREAPLVVEFVADEVLHAWRGFFAEHAGLERHVVHAGDDVGQVVLAEMVADSRARLELGLLRQVDGDVLGLPALLVEPLLHHLLVVDDLDARLEDVERQTGEPAGVQGTELVLIAVVIRRPENLVAHAALCHERVGALGRVDLGFFRLVKRVKMPGEHMVHRLVLGEPDRLVHLAEEQRLGDGAVLLFPRLEDDEIPFRLGQDQPRDVEQRVGAAGVLDLPGERLDALFLRLDDQVQLQRRARGRVVAPKVVFLVERALAVALLEFRPPVVPAIAIAVAIPVAAALLVAALEVTAAVVVAPTRRSVAPVAATATAGFLLAGIVGVWLGVVRFLRPSGEKLQFQIQLLERIGVLGFTHCG